MSFAPRAPCDCDDGGGRGKGKGSEFEREMDEATKLAQGFGRAMTQAFTSAVVGGKKFDDVLKGLVLRLSSMAVNAALKPLQQGFADLLSGLFGGQSGEKAGPPLDLSQFMRPQPGAPLDIRPPDWDVRPFAAGGVIGTPTYFPLGPSLGLAGEKGAEAILPLSRGSDGRLGVRTQSEARPLSVTVNVSTPDAASFRRSEAYLSGAIARAVSRGERSL